MIARVLIALGLLALTACGSSDEPDLMQIRQPAGAGPDEFSVLPSKPLTMPDDMAALPAPTPGGANRTDPTPEADAILALGGNPSALQRPSRDGALLAYAGRFGVAPNIRGELATADLAFRRANDGRFLERLFNVNVYYDSYESMSLNQHAELERLRRAGIRTSSAPPESVTE